MPRARRLLPALIVLALAMPGAAAATPAQVPGPADSNPLLGQSWWVDHEWSVSWRDAQRLQRQGQTAQAALIHKIADQPQFVWYGRWAGSASPARRLSKDLDRFARQSPGSVPQLVTMRHEGRECHPGYLGGGARADTTYRSWIRGFADAVGQRRVVVVFEPDALGTLECLARSRRKARLRTLAYGVDVLSRLPNATVYLDAGASDWQGASRVAPKLRAIGIAKVRGFALNATHQDWTHRNAAYGARMSRLVGGKRFVINTSHNGNGPMHRKVWIDRRKNIWRIENTWCNPPNSVLGERPTAVTGRPRVDAHVWIERPGYSNGACNGGPAKVGAWWRARALTMARGAKW